MYVCVCLCVCTRAGGRYHAPHHVRARETLAVAMQGFRIVKPYAFGDNCGRIQSPSILDILNTILNHIDITASVLFRTIDTCVLRNGLENNVTCAEWKILNILR